MQSSRVGTPKSPHWSQANSPNAFGLPLPRVLIQGRPSMTPMRSGHVETSCVPQAAA